MKPTGKQLHDLQARIADAFARSGYSCAEIARITQVHPSQVGRICSGQFKTFSHNVMQVCKALSVTVPRLGPDLDAVSAELAAAHSSMRRIWDETPEGAKAITKLLNAIADLRAVRQDDGSDGAAAKEP